MAWINLEFLAKLVAILFGLFGLAFIYNARSVGNWPKRMGIAILSFLVVLFAVNLTKSAVIFYRAPLPLCRALFGLDTLLTPILPLLVSAYFLHCCGEDWRRSSFMYIQYVLTGLILAAIIIHQLTGAIHITPDYVLAGTPWSGFYLFMSSALTAICLIALF